MQRPAPEPRGSVLPRDPRPGRGSAYDAAERHFAEQAHIEVVLIGSDWLDTLRRAHANYFDGTAALERPLPTG